MGTTLGNARRVSNSVGKFAVHQFSAQPNGNIPVKAPRGATTAVYPWSLTAPVVTLVTLAFNQQP